MFYFWGSREIRAQRAQLGANNSTLSLYHMCPSLGVPAMINSNISLGKSEFLAQWKWHISDVFVLESPPARCKVGYHMC